MRSIARAGLRLATGLLVCLPIGCSAPRLGTVAAHAGPGGADIPPPVARAIAQRRVVPGMTPEQVRMAWGEPFEQLIDAIDPVTRQVRWFRYLDTFTVGSGAPWMECEVRFDQNRVVQLVVREP